MGLVRKLAWTGIYPWTAGERVAPRLGLGADVTGISDAISAGTGYSNAMIAIRESDWAQCQGWASYLNPGCYFTGSRPAPVVGTAPAPSEDLWTVAPKSGEEAAATVQTLSDEAMRRQQAIDATNVQASWLDRVSSGIVDTADSVNPFSGNVQGLSWLAWGALGLMMFALVTSISSPRRYGR